MEKIEANGNMVWVLPIPFFLAGLGVGAVLTALFTPRSGAATRRLIGRTVHEGEDWMKSTASAAQDFVKSQGADLRDRAKEVAEVTGRD